MQPAFIVVEAGGQHLARRLLAVEPQLVAAKAAGVGAGADDAAGVKAFFEDELALLVLIGRSDPLRGPRLGKLASLEKGRPARTAVAVVGGNGNPPEIAGIGRKGQVWGIA